MRKLIAAAAVLLMIAQPVFAKPAGIALPDKADTVLVPEHSPLTFAKFGPDGAIFTGKLTLGGTYYYGDGEYNDGPTVDLVLYFQPDAASAALLPSLKTRGPAQSLVLSNAAVFAKAVLSAQQLAALQKKGAPYATGQARIVVDTVEAGVVCDGASFSARFVSLAKPGAAHMAPSPGFGC
ncbi:MAG TPA: hypothetical protein VHZ78_14025 [Rhizomicrobium sp.]|jgi:hypothetical protein|nr:hypothetical protein [Rhizomicrobium sp.]